MNTYQDGLPAATRTNRVKIPAAEYAEYPIVTERKEVIMTDTETHKAKTDIQVSQRVDPTIVRTGRRSCRQQPSSMVSPE